ncbi:MAG TPA: bifunctional riboflavin kinase/FAD synthetase [Anaerolineales bacterium]|nr:bifunctional riboflavin kinase/FAD synthetase [Anaerolineales bacterium]HLO34381.1 bifunctional riboflavin kinase/FAD synthetase [Anaerolineales bacterium]
MQHYRSLEEVNLQNSWLTIGVFDGVHRGHQEILKKLTAGAHANGAPAVVLTFDPHPASVLGGQEIKCLTLPDERAELLGKLGVDVVITEHFTRELSAVTAYDFMSRLVRQIGLQHLLIGYDFALGKGREGNAKRLTEIGSELRYTVDVVPALSEESGVISSTEIRKLIEVGNVAEATRLLGHLYSLHGPVIHGDGRGKTINVPTANIAYSHEKMIPAKGIYACWAYLNDRRYRAAINIGTNPTFTPDKQIPNVEAHLLDFRRELYGEDLRLEFVERLRAELKFDSVDVLVEQIWKDVAIAREVLAE